MKPFNNNQLYRPKPEFWRLFTLSLQKPDNSSELNTQPPTLNIKTAPNNNLINVVQNSKNFNFLLTQKKLYKMHYK